VPVEDHLGVAGKHQVALYGARLAASVLDDDLARIAGRELLDLGRLDGELDPQLLEDGSPLRRGGREN
jgi:hypothetical protein